MTKGSSSKGNKFTSFEYEQVQQPRLPPIRRNFFKSASYTIEALCAASFVEEKQMLIATEAKILTKRADLSKFESEYREVLAQFTEMTSRYMQEMQSIDELLKQRDEIHAAYTSGPPLKCSTSKTKIRSSPKDKDGREDGEMIERELQ